MNNENRSHLARLVTQFYHHQPFRRIDVKYNMAVLSLVCILHRTCHQKPMPPNRRIVYENVLNNK